MDTETEQNQVTRFPKYGASPIRSKLIEKLKDGKIGDRLTDAELTAYCGQPTRVGGKGYGALLRAIYYVYRHFGLVWQREREADAIVCLNADSIVTTSDKATKHIRKTATRTRMKLQTIDLQSVRLEDRPGVLSRIAQHGMVAQFTKPSAQRKIEVAGVGSGLNISKILEAASKPTERAKPGQ